MPTTKIDSSASHGVADDTGTNLIQLGGSASVIEPTGMAFLLDLVVKILFLDENATSFSVRLFIIEPIK